MRIVVTGQVGVGKKPFLRRVAELAAEEGQELAIFNVGDLMYAEAPDVPAGRILDLPLGRLTALRRSVFKDILAACPRHPHVLVNTHATFRWRHGLFYAFDYDQMQALDANLYVAMVDNIHDVHRRLVHDGHADHTLKDLIVWREEEILATELLSQIVRGHGRFYIVARGADDSTAAAMLRLIFYPHIRKAYLSFPMSHVDGEADGREVQAEIDDFRRQMKRYFTCFDPADVEEKYLGALALEAARQGKRTVDIGAGPQRVSMDTSQLLDILADIDGQIYARDFKLIDQSDMILSLVPRLSGGRPGLSSGVERELQHAHEAAKDVFVIWRPEAPPSPFVTETATKVFPSVADAVRFFHANGYVPSPPGKTLFG
jgi:adenylate kinase